MTQQINILDYIPQRPPFVMIDKIISVTEQQTITSFQIMDDNLFCEDGVFYEAGLIENIAQTVAAGAGYSLKKKNESPKIGVIGTIKNLKISNRPCAGDTLITEVNLITAFEHALVLEGKVSANNIQIASCRMNIFIIGVP